MNKITIGDSVYIIDDDAYSKIESICIKSSDGIFDRHSYGTHYHYITDTGRIGDTIETGSKYDEDFYNAANYCTDYMTLYDRSLVELLTRRIWRWGESKGALIDPKADSGLRCWAIDWCEKGPYVALHIGRTPGAIYFTSEDYAKEALNEVVIPFIANNPDFCW